MAKTKRKPASAKAGARKRLGVSHPRPAEAATESLGSPKAPRGGGPAPKGRKASQPPAGGAKMAAPTEEAAVRPVVTESMREAAKLKSKRGTRLPPVLVAANKPKEVEWKRGEYGVFIDHHRFSCIRVGEGSVVEFIPMTGKALDVHRQDAARWNERWKPFMYPLIRAAETYVEGAKSRGITAEARDHLGRILGRSLETLKITTEEEMGTKKAKKNEATKTEATESAGNTVTASAPEKKGKGKITVTTVKNGEKTVKTTDKVPTPKADKIKMLSREDAAKVIKAGGKIKVGRDNDTRKGSLRWTAIEAVRAAGTVDAALKATFKFKGIKQQVKFTDVRSAVRRGYVVIVKK